MKKTTLLSALILFSCIGHAQSWDIKGNANTDPLKNFIGTKDQQPLIFKVNKQPSGNIDFSPATANTTFGYQSYMVPNQYGIYNTAFGFQTLYSNKTGKGNIAFGMKALYANTDGQYNLAVGVSALSHNTTGNYNIAIGATALGYNTTGGSNVAVGHDALLYNTSGKFNVATGYDALWHNTTAFYNVVSGYRGGYFNTTGYQNVAEGAEALFYNTTGYSNAVVGYQAYYNGTSGHGNTAMGWHALYTNTTGNYNTAIGQSADVSSAAFTNATAIGYGTKADASNKVRIGNTSVTSIGGQVSWSVFSDARVKKQIKNNVPGLAFIKLLKPATYHYDIAKENELLGLTGMDESQVNKEFETKLFSGFLAQEVDEAAAKAGYDFSGIDKTGKIMGLRYAEFVVPLVKSVQELSDMNDELKAKNKELEARLEKLETMLSENQSTSSQKTAITNIKMNGAVQNFPNPFRTSTTIKYNVPLNAVSAFIKITDMNGNVMKSISITERGEGQVAISASGLASGTYTCTLYANNTKIESRQMVVMK